jgi:hypothetical protein
MLLISMISRSQTKREILAEDPKQAPNLRMELTPLNIYASDLNSSATWSGRVSYRHNNKFSVSGSFSKEFYDEQETSLDGNNYDYGKPLKGVSMEFTGTYYFKVTEKESREYMPLKSRRTGYNSVEVTVDPVPMTKLALYGVRVGYANVQGTNSFMNMNLYEEKNPSSALTAQYAIPLQKRNMVSVGISATRIKNLKVSYPRYGVRRKQIIREYYADVMYPATNSFSTVMNYGTIYVVDKSSPMLGYGFRVGLLSSPNGKIINFGYGLEAGVMPGAESLRTNYYINFRLVFSLFTKIGLKSGE